jgi:hypothetical protein
MAEIHRWDPSLPRVAVEEWLLLQVQVFLVVPAVAEMRSVRAALFNLVAPPHNRHLPIGQSMEMSEEMVVAIP